MADTTATTRLPGRIEGWFHAENRRDTDDRGGPVAIMHRACAVRGADACPAAAITPSHHPRTAAGGPYLAVAVGLADGGGTEPGGRREHTSKPTRGQPEARGADGARGPSVPDQSGD